jgi:hypothetical protein
MPNSIAYLLGFAITIGIIAFCVGALFKAGSIVAKILAILFLTGGLCSVLSMVAGLINGIDFVQVFNWVATCFKQLVEWLTHFFNNLISNAKALDGGGNATSFIHFIPFVF